MNPVFIREYTAPATRLVYLLVAVRPVTLEVGVTNLARESYRSNAYLIEVWASVMVCVNPVVVLAVNLNQSISVFVGAILALMLPEFMV